MSGIRALALRTTLPIVINNRFERQKLTGVQRYACEIARAAGGLFERASVNSRFKPVEHVLEQIFMPAITRGKLLFSPANIGPLYKADHVVTIHDLSPLDHPEWFSASFAKWYQMAIPEIARSCRAIITVSHFSKSRIVAITGVNPRKVHVIHNGVSQLEASGGGDVPAATGRYILSVGSIEPRKNLSRLIEAWSSIADTGGARLVIVGERGHVFRDAEVGDVPENLAFTGRLSDEELATFYRNATGFVYVSLYEGFGLPPLEAMLGGAPVLVSRVTSLPEVCGPAFAADGGRGVESWFAPEPGARYLFDMPATARGTALYCDPFSVKDIARGLIELLSLSGECRELIQAQAREWASRFTWEKCARETLDVLDACGSTWVII